MRITQCMHQVLGLPPIPLSDFGLTVDDQSPAFRIAIQRRCWGELLRRQVSPTQTVNHDGQRATKNANTFFSSHAATVKEAS
jgi:hypothetical protein